ncbi:hypothetical protein PNK_1081 [Candidatus Protochlamydia naegleriophila]|uniref:Uncharacterized protein n=1 Tax=Candidatus Protochlamydia naegleriophila TaxID=389348 RepID=A0A0U5JCZ9_9BACT|nr:hypothetical protein [Candidatus Protochlamydia naegleriophila]CUI16698.1 hypothetical protein PNK_1081 [Candidatus Protochlamydia naegleriophila]
MLKHLKLFLGLSLTTLSLSLASPSFADNQTPSVSPILSEEDLPFRVQVELADFGLPNGIHSYAFGRYRNKWLFIAGRTNGMHGFNPDTGNFPLQQQNRVIYVVDPEKKKVYSRALTDPQSGLTLEQVDLLSVTSPQSYQRGHTLYITGGYGVDSATGQFSTKPFLTAINLPGLIHWVTHHSHHETAAQHIRQISDPIFQVTGGYMAQVDKGPTLLVFGQNFRGFYVAESNGEYTQQVRRFRILDNGKKLSFIPLSSKPEEPNPDLRRRDLNIVPMIFTKAGKQKEGLVAFSGVFTPTTGIWTVPVEISRTGKSFMANPAKASTFKQGMNNYTCPFLGIFSCKDNAVYTIFFGGISFGYFVDGQFQTDSEFPFINQFTTIKRSHKGLYTQHLMSSQYPVILSTESNPGNQLLFGAGADFIPSKHLPRFNNDIAKLEEIDRPILAGYIVGGIQSTLPNTNTLSDSAASPYIFKVTLIPVKD